MKTRRIERRLILLALSLFMALVLLHVIAVRVHAEGENVIPESDYLTFKAEENGSSVMMKYASATSLQYKKSTDTAWQNYTAGTAIPLDKEESVRFRGNNVTFDSSNHVNITGKVACSGNIMSLRMDDEGKNQGLSDYCFSFMFKGCTDLRTAPELSATNLVKYCYSYMFSGCTGLTVAPELPAENLAQGCYSDMFNGCTGLTTAPELPAATLVKNCYSDMFDGCTGLTTAPELPATTLAEYCYFYMFRGCTGLKVAPKLPATTLAKGCYEGMFFGCTGLTSAPELPATTLAVDCYFNMFCACMGLKSTPELPATTLAEYCYSHMFYGCTGLTTAPKLPATTLAEGCYEGMFNGCTGIKLSTKQMDEYNYVYRIPSSGTGTTAQHALDDMFKNTGGTFTGTSDINTTYYTNDIPGSDYLSFTAEEDSSSVMMKYASATSLQYKKSTDAAWQNYTAGTAISLNNGDSVCFRGNNVTFDYDHHVNITGKVACSGNIMSLRMDDEGKDQGLSDSCFN